MAPRDRIRFRESRRRDWWRIAADLRPDDLREVSATNSSALTAVRESVRGSTEAYTMLVDGQPAAALGVAELEDEEGMFWVLSTTAVDRVRVSYVSWAQRWMTILLADYLALWTCIDRRHRRAVRLAGWLGFREIGAANVGPETFGIFRLEESWVRPSLT